METGDGTEQSRLPRPVRPYDRDDLTSRNFEADAEQDLHLAIAGVDAGDFEHGHISGTGRTRGSVRRRSHLRSCAHAHASAV
jgi:hypothetical protein